MKKFISIPILFITLICSATHYYVKNAGSDAANGWTDGTAWQTVNKVNISNFNAGDTISFNKGDLWREQLTIPSAGTSGAYIVFNSYGTGNKPQILGSEIATAWTNRSGNVWKSDDTFNDPYALSWDGNIFFKETNGTVSWGKVKKTTWAECIAEYNWTWHGDTIYIYSPTDPNTRYSGVEVAQLNRGFLLNNQEYICIDGIEIAYQAVQGIGGDTNPPAGALDGLIVKNCIIHHIGIKESGYGLWTYRSDLIVKDNIIHDTGRRGISLNLGSVTDPIVNMTNILVEGNIFYNGFHTTGIDVINSSSGTMSIFVLRNNYIYDNPNDVIDAVEYFLSTGIYLSVQGTGQGLGVIDSVLIYNNIIANNKVRAILLDDVTSAYIYNNTLAGINPSVSSTTESLVELDGSECDIVNNIFFNNSTATGNPSYRCIDLYYQSHASTGVVNYNLYYHSTSDVYNFRSAAGNYYRLSEFATWQGLDYDVDSPTPANPLFYSTINYHLQSGSPTIHSGTNVGITTDFNGNNRFNPPSIGAYEMYPKLLQTSTGKLFRLLGDKVIRQ